MDSTSIAERSPAHVAKEMLRVIAGDAVRRGRWAYSTIWQAPFRLAAQLAAQAAPIAVLPGLFPGTHAAYTKEFEPVATLTPEQAESVDQEGGDFFMDVWARRGAMIRSGDSVYTCLANLTAALDQVGQLNAADYNGAAGALSLLPTAGALLGAPSKEMWIVYKLVPLAGILSMFLSLGATIAPDNATDFDPEKKTLYGGLMPTVSDNSHLRNEEIAKSMRMSQNSPRGEVEMTPAQIFAERVRRRAEQNDKGGRFRGKIWAGIMLQVVLIAIIIIPMWFAQQGAVITWWCRSWGWMWFWYFLVTVVSISESLLAAPFSKSWTIRVSKAPSNIRVAPDAARITERNDKLNALEYLRTGVNIVHRIGIPAGEPSSYSKTCFYVVISVEGITNSHAAMKLISKWCSVAVYAFGTAVFASATLMSISVALMVLSLVLSSGVMGRVIVMWIASEMNKTAKPVLHAVVPNETDAGSYFDAIAKLNLQIETQGYVIVNGIAVKQRKRLFSPETYIGLLAKPFNIVKLAQRSSGSGGMGNSFISPPPGGGLMDDKHIMRSTAHEIAPV